LVHTQALLAAGKGRLQRDTESGQLLFDLVEHADVAEWALWINSFGDTLYKAVWGDKDTYGMAFAVAGKAHMFNQLQVSCSGQQRRSTGIVRRVQAAKPQRTPVDELKLRTAYCTWQHACQTVCTVCCAAMRTLDGGTRRAVYRAVASAIFDSECCIAPDHLDMPRTWYILGYTPPPTSCPAESRTCCIGMYAQVPPGAALTWRKDRLLLKATQQKQPGWELAGMLQYDAIGQPAFFHRTLNKFRWKGEAWHIGLLTGPLPLR
jgi:hypothetical protein